MRIIDLNDAQVDEVERKLDAFDRGHMGSKLDGSIQIGIVEDGKLVAGLDACMTAFRILYVSTVFVEEAYRRKGYGTRLIREMERRAEELGANIIRLDTFSWQGKDFYEVLGYEVVGSYQVPQDGYGESFFVKKLTPLPCKGQ